MVKTNKYSRFVLMSLSEIRNTNKVILQITDTQTNFDTGHKCYLCEVVDSINYYSEKATSDLIKEVCCLNAEKRKLERKISRLEKMVATDINVGGRRSM